MTELCGGWSRDHSMQIVAETRLIYVTCIAKYLELLSELKPHT